MTRQVETIAAELVDAIRSEVRAEHDAQPQLLLSVEQARGRLSISRTHLYKLMDGDPPRLPSRKLGRRRLLHAADVDAFASSRS